MFYPNRSTHFFKGTIICPVCLQFSCLCTKLILKYAKSIESQPFLSIVRRSLQNVSDSFRLHTNKEAECWTLSWMLGFHWWPQKSQNIWHLPRIRTLSLATYTCSFSHLTNFTFAPCLCYYLSSLTKANSSYNGGK